MRDQALQLHALQPGGELVQDCVSDFRAGRQRMRTKLPAHKVKTLSFIGQRNGDGGHAGVLHDTLVQLNLVFRDQADGNVSVEKVRVAGPALEDDQRIAVLGGHAGDVTGGRDGFSKVDDQGDLFAVGDAQAEVIIQDIEHRVRIARQATVGKVSAVEAVIAFQGAAEVGL